MKKLEFELDIESLSDIRLSLTAKNNRSRYSIHSLGSDATELSVLAGDWDSGYSQDNLIKYISKTHNLTDVKHRPWDNQYWKFYTVTYDWKAHKVWATPLIINYELSILEEKLQKYSTSDLEEIIRRRRIQREEK